MQKGQVQIFIDIKKIPAKVVRGSMNLFLKKRRYSGQYLEHLKRFRRAMEDIRVHSNLTQTDDYLQHGSTTRYLHSVAVAYYSYRVALFFGLHLHLYEVIRGAMAHDYYLYDTKDGSKQLRGHGVKHPQIALENAEKDFALSDLERDIIVKHMFPITRSLPKYKESYVVTTVDKCCAVYEFFARRTPYPLISAMLLDQKSKKYQYPKLENVLPNES